MKPTAHRPQRLRRLFSTLLLLCLLGCLAWASNRYNAQIDLTANASNTLSVASQKLLASLPDKIQVTAFIKKGQPIRPQIAQLIDRYKRYKPDLAFSFIDPDLHPEQTRELDIGPEGIVLVEYQGRIDKLKFIDEASLTNTLLKLANAQERWVTFLSGHGERAPDGQANFDLGQFSKELALRKINTQAVNLTNIPAIPDNSALLVITPPAVPLLDGELAIIKHYIDGGGNLLILTDPDGKHLETLEQALGFRRLPGILVDTGAKFYGVKDPSFILANTYNQHPLLQGFKTITLYPVTAALAINKENTFKAETLLSSSKESWNETGPIAGQISRDTQQDESQGPLAFAYALTRKTSTGAEQRVVIVGDGDFLSNAYIGNVGNLDMGLRMVNWLSHDDHFINIDAKTATDKSLQLSEMAVAILGFGLLLFTPLALLATGFFIWRKRKRR